MTITKEIIDAIYVLNREIYEQTQLEYIGFKLNTDGMTLRVEFAGIWIWDADDDSDERIFNETTLEYEPLIKFLRRLAIKEIAKLSSIWEDFDEVDNDG